MMRDLSGSRVPRDTRYLSEAGDHLLSLNTTYRPIAYVPWGKGEKTPGEVKRTWNPCLTSIRAPYIWTATAFCRMNRRVMRYLARLSPYSGPVAKASLNRALVSRSRPRNRVIYPWAGWSWCKASGGPNPLPLKRLGWLVDRGEIPIKLRDSWFSPKYI